MVLICAIVGVNRRHALVAQEAAQKVAEIAAEETAPCPEPMSKIVGQPEKLVPLPDYAGWKLDMALDKLEGLGIKDIDWESTDPDDKVGHSRYFRRVVRTKPRAGCDVGPSDRVTFYARYG